ncbi:MAG: hypothetical protein EHM72_08505 [Calditrichaeota bacterium]|nr:MAG: hypothetical protein EHM72_08505 [Calditrichota bacterium]
MTENELKNTVEHIVALVLKRLERDPELAKLIVSPKDPDASTQAPQWARTCTSYHPSKPQSSGQLHQKSDEKRLYTESDILELARNGVKQLTIQPKTIMTPAARDVAQAKGIDIIVNVSVQKSEFE